MSPAPGKRTTIMMQMDMMLFLGFSRISSYRSFLAAALSEETFHGINREISISQNTSSNMNEDPAHITHTQCRHQQTFDAAVRAAVSHNTTARNLDRIGAFHIVNSCKDFFLSGD